MQLPEITLYTTDELATRLNGKVSRDRIEDYLNQGILKYTVLLSGKFLKYRVLENAEKILCGCVTRGKHLFDPRYDEFIINNYPSIAPDCHRNFIDLENAQLLRWEDDGFWYEYNMIGDIPKIQTKDLFVAKEDVAQLEIEIGTDEATGDKMPKPKNSKTRIGTDSNKRHDALAKILLQIISDYREKHQRDPQCNEVMNKLKSLCKDRKHNTIQEVVDGKVEWRNAKGLDKTTSSKQIQNRLIRLKKV